MHDRLWITLPETHEPVINYTITDLLGKVQASGASTNRSVDVQALASGMYTLMIDHAGVREGVRFVERVRPGCHKQHKTETIVLYLECVHCHKYPYHETTPTPCAQFFLGFGRSSWSGSSLHSGPRDAGLVERGSTWIVDGAGVMDTLHAGIPLLDTVIFSIPGMGNSVDLFGLQFLDALVRFNVSAYADLVAMNFPATLEDLTISISTGSVTLGTLPESLDRMVVGSNSAGFSLDILAMPDSMGSMLLVELTDLTCASPGYVEYLHISFAIPSTEDISLPAINTSFLWLDYMSTVAYDLSAMTASSVSMPAFGVWSELEWPAGVRSITMDFITGPLPAWPSTLEFLRMGLVEGCLPPFPNGLSTLHFTYETPCIPNWPDSLVSIYRRISCLIAKPTPRIAPSSTAPAWILSGHQWACLRGHRWRWGVRPWRTRPATSERNRATQWQYSGLWCRWHVGDRRSAGCIRRQCCCKLSLPPEHHPGNTQCRCAGDGEHRCRQRFRRYTHPQHRRPANMALGSTRTPRLRQPALPHLPELRYHGVGRGTHPHFRW
ncbi:MAG: T9SS type A sorting domain-containing protein [Flavobacteriales bacterium]|nr:T9SS type A sorting domain-containing protein [Flavobacteriales bacterium]